MAKKKRKKKDPAAVALGKKGARARMKKLSPEVRKEIARRAVQARWDSREK